jgi:DNA-binding winged helix-turn-helix (wHTH) protein
MRAGHTILSAEDLLAQVWDEHTDPFTNTVHVTISRRRPKLGHPPVIETIPSVEYQITGASALNRSQVRPLRSKRSCCQAAAAAASEGEAAAHGGVIGSLTQLLTVATAQALDARSERITRKLIDSIDIANPRLSANTGR